MNFDFSFHNPAKIYFRKNLFQENCIEYFEKSILNI